MTTIILRTVSSLSSNGKNAPLPHEDDCCIKSLLPTAQAVVAIPTTTAPVVTTKGPLALGSATKALLKALVFKAMNAKTAASNLKKPSLPAPPLKIPGQLSLPSFPSNITVATMCSEEDDFQSLQGRLSEAVADEQPSHEQELAAARAFLSLEELSEARAPVVMPLRKVRKTKVHRQLLHSHEELELLLPVRVMV